MNNDKYEMFLKNIISNLVGELQKVRVFNDVGFASFVINNLIINVDVRRGGNNVT